MAAGRVVKGIVRLRVNAGKAQPSPTLGQSLGPLGVNMVEFCGKFNEATAGLKAGIPAPVTLTAFDDRTFSFVVKTPPTAYLLRQAAEVDKGASEPGKDTVGTVSARQIYEIAKVKQTDEHLRDQSLEALSKSIVGTAYSMGLEVSD